MSTQIAEEPRPREKPKWPVNLQLKIAGCLGSVTNVFNRASTVNCESNYRPGLRLAVQHLFFQGLVSLHRATFGPVRGWYCFESFLCSFHHPNNTQRCNDIDAKPKSSINNHVAVHLFPRSGG